MRLDPPRLGVALAPRQIVEAHRHPVAHGLRERQQHVERHRRGARLSGAADGRHLHSIEAMPQP